MRRRILILEDLEISRKALVRMVQECGDELEVYAFGDMASALACAVEEKIDIFLVDIILKPDEVNDFSGITFAKTIRELDKYSAAEIIFITTLAGLEAEMLRMIHCFDYIEKPISKERVQKVIHDVLLKLDGKRVERELVFVRKEYITYPIYADEIAYLEYHRRKLYIHTCDEIVEAPYQALKDFIRKIQTQTFLMTAKGYAVNVAYIESMDTISRFVKIRGMEDRVEIGVRMKGAFLKEFQKLERRI